MEEKKLTEYEKYQELLDEFEDLLPIDETDLHNEWRLQPVIYRKYSEALSMVSLVKDMVKNELEKLRAKLYIKIKEDGLKNNKKLTESHLESYILVDEEYQKMERKFINIMKMERSFIGCIKSLDQRKKALEGLVQLYVNEYFSIPREPKTRKSDSFNEERRKKTEETKSNQRKGLNKKNKA